MNIVIWVVQALLTFVYLMSGSNKFRKTPEQLRTEMGDNMAWTNDFTANQVKMIGTAELLGAVGMILPAATKILPWLTPVAALGLAILMAGAVYTHIRRSEPQGIAVTTILLLLNLFVVLGRFVLEPISG